MLQVERQKAGRKQEYDWSLVEIETLRLMDSNGDFDRSKRSWNAQARLEDALLDFCERKLGREPSPAALRRNLSVWLETWRSSRCAAAE